MEARAGTGKLHTEWFEQSFLLWGNSNNQYPPGT